MTLKKRHVIIHLVAHRATLESELEGLEPEGATSLFCWFQKRNADTDEAVTRQSMDEQVHEKIAINGQEYDPAEAQNFIDRGKQTIEAERKWNTSLDKVWPEYGKSRETLKQMESQLAEARSQLEKFQTKQEAGTETPADEAKAKEAAKRLGLILKDDLDSSGYIKKDELDKYLSERDQEREAVKQVLSQAETLEKELDGSDGRPKFNKKIVLAYANTYGKADLKEAYEEMHEDTLKSWKKEQIDAEKKPELKTFNAGDKKQPERVKVTDANVKDLLREKLG